MSSEEPLVITLPRLHRNQSEVAKDESRFQVLVCGRRWGKTRLGAVLSLKALLLGKRVWWIAPTYSIAGIAWEQVRSMARPLGMAPLESARTIKSERGGFISFKSADNPDNLRGEGLDLVIIDEADFIARRVWEEVIRPALADRKGRALIISTPNIEGGWFHELFQRGQTQDDEVKSWQFPSWSNPFLDKGEIEAARTTLPSIVFRREFGAEFVSASGALLRREWIRKAVPPRRSELEVCIGVDLAISTKDGADWTAVAVMGKERNGKLWMLDVSRTRSPFHEVLQFIQAMAAKWDPSVIAVEQVQYQAAVVTELLRTTDLPVIGIRPDKDKVTRFTGLQARFEQGLVTLSADLPPEFERELLGFPVTEHDDMVDAMVYAHRAFGSSDFAMS